MKKKTRARPEQNLEITLQSQRTLLRLGGTDLSDLVHSSWTTNQQRVAVLVGACSGAWPALKLVLLAFASLCPRSLLSPSCGEALFATIDALGKWALAYGFVMVMTVTAGKFHVAMGAADGSVVRGVVSSLSSNIPSNIPSSVPDDHVALDVLNTAGSGFGG